MRLHRSQPEIKMGSEKLTEKDGLEAELDVDSGLATG